MTLNIQIIKTKFIFFIIIFFFNNIYYSQDNSLRFDGVNDYILISDHPDLDLTSNYTLEAWIFPESFSWLSGIISKYHSSASNGYMLRLNQNPPYSGIGFDELETTNGILNNNEWIHIAAVKNSNSRKVYVNGIEINLSGNALNVSSNSDPLRIASDYSGRFFHGRIDEVRIWNIARTLDDILSTKDTTLIGDETGLIAYYTFNEGFGDTLFDLTENNHSGILYGSPQWVDGFSTNSNLGDINFDEMLNIYDAVQLVMILLNNNSGNDQQLIACDTNEDGIIDINDVVLLIQWILNLDFTHRSLISSFDSFHENNSIIINSNGDLAAFSIQFEKPVSLNDDFQIPYGWSFKKEKNKLIGFSIDGSSFPLDYKIEFEEFPIIEQISVSDWKGNKRSKEKNLKSNFFKFKAFPNPFNNKCRFIYNQPINGQLFIEIYDIRSNLILSLNKGFISKGNYEFDWNPEGISSGIYFVQFNSNNMISNNKIIYLK